MVTFTATEARNNIGKLWEAAANEPVLVEAAGKPMVVVMSAEEYNKLTGSPRKPRIAGTGANLLANLDVDDLLSTPIDEVFEEYM